MTLQKGKNTITAKAADAAGNEAQPTSMTVKVVSPPSAGGVDSSWWWTVAGLLVALGIGFPLTMLFVTMGLRTRRRGG